MSENKDLFDTNESKIENTPTMPEEPSQNSGCLDDMFADDVSEENSIETKFVDFSSFGKKNNNSLVDIDINKEEVIEDDYVEVEVPEQEIVQEQQIPFNQPMQAMPQSNIPQQAQSVQEEVLNVNGGLTIHTERKEKKPLSKKAKRLMIVSIVLLVLLIIGSVVVLLLKAKGVILQPTIYEIYQTYNYNYTNDVVKFNYDGEDNIYFIEEDDKITMIDRDNTNNKLTVYLDNTSLSSMEENFKEISNKNQYDEISDELTIKNTNYDCKNEEVKLSVLSKELSCCGKTMVVVFEKTEDNNTLQNIYNTIVFVDFQ